MFLALLYSSCYADVLILHRKHDCLLCLQALSTRKLSITGRIPCLSRKLTVTLLLLQGSTLDAQSGMPESDYDNALNHIEMEESGFVFLLFVVCRIIYIIVFIFLTVNALHLSHRSTLSNFSRASGWPGDGTVPQSENLSEGECDSTLPCTEDVISKTELITKNIQELLRAAQENKHER